MNIFEELGNRAREDHKKDLEAIERIKKYFPDGEPHTYGFAPGEVQVRFPQGGTTEKNIIDARDNEIKSAFQKWVASEIELWTSMSTLPPEMFALLTAPYQTVNLAGEEVLTNLNTSHPAIYKSLISATSNFMIRYLRKLKDEDLPKWFREPLPSIVEINIKHDDAEEEILGHAKPTQS